MAPLNLCFYLLFYVLLLSLFTRITSALFKYDKRTLLDIGHRCTNLLQDTLRGRRAGICNRLRERAHSPPLPRIFHQSSLLPFTFHHRQTLAWLCPNSTMSSAATSINTLTLPLSSPGTLTKPNSRRSCRTFTNMYPVLLEDRIHWIIATLSLRMPTKLVPCQLLANDCSGTPGGEGSDALVLPLWSYATGGSWWRRLGHVPGEFIWRPWVHGCSIKLCQHANRASHWNGNNKDIL